MENLRFQDGKFRVMLVGDPHCYRADESPHDRAILKDYLALQNAALDEAKPDLAVLMGDNARGKSREEIREVLLRMTQPYAQRGIPFTFVLGNHDLELEGLTRKELYGIYADLPGICMPEEIGEFGDFELRVRDPASGRAALQLLLVYSGASPGPEAYSYYDWVLPEQNDWIRRTAAACTKENGPTPAVLLQHIPVPEEYGLLRRRSALCMVGDGVCGQNELKGSYYVKKKGVQGWLGEAPCVPAMNSGEFEAMKETQTVFAAFFGHDHMNDFVGMTDGIILGQCKTASFNVYGDGLRQGVRLLDFDLNAPFALDTRMLTYRELLGRRCESLHGSIAVLHDKLSVKLELLAKVGAVSTAVTAPALLAKLLIKRNRGKRSHG